MRLIDADGEQVGLIAFEEALEKAESKDLDLVEVAPDADPPVCKIMDYRRYTFEQKRRLKESRKKAKHFEMKEIKLRPNIGKHDYDIKLKMTRGFLEKGHKVKITMRYRPREMRQFRHGLDVLHHIADDLIELAEVDLTTRNKERARMQSIVLMRKKNLRTKEPPKEKAEEPESVRT